jgi:hypothetical protein
VLTLSERFEIQADRRTDEGQAEIVRRLGRSGLWRSALLATENAKD